MRPGTADRRAAVEALRRSRPTSPLVRGTVLVFALAVAAVWTSGELAVGDLVADRRLDNLERFLARDAMPFPLQQTGFTWSGLVDWASDILAARGWDAMLATLWISVLAIVLAGAAAAILSPLGARTLMTPDPYGVASARRAASAWRLAVGATRFLCVVLRAIPEYVWAFLLLAMLGPNAWPAVIALAIHNAGILGRLGAETVENLDAAPLRALAAAGADRARLATSVALPLALPRLLLYFFYRFETCVREATVLGMLGTISLGYWIQEARGRQHYDEMLLLVALGALLVLLGDVLSFAARRWVRRA